jgi:cytochrome b
MKHGVRVWDPVVRIAHWGLAALIAIDLFNDSGANPWHRGLGYAAGAVVLARLLWGVLGPAHARLTAIARTAGELASYVSGPPGAAHRYVAHNPLGASMAITLWGLTLFVVATGWALQLDRFWGDELMQSIHAFSSYTLAALVIVHVAGAIVGSVRGRVNLVKAMITGDKKLL